MGNKPFQVSTKLTAAKVRGQNMFEPCLVVTSGGVFVLKCARDPVTTFLECAMQGDIKTAEHTASTFELDGRGLLELVNHLFSNSLKPLFEHVSCFTFKNQFSIE